MLADVDGRATPRKGIDDNVKRFGIDIEQMIKPAHFAVAVMLGAIPVALLLRPPDVHDGEGVVRDVVGGGAFLLCEICKNVVF